MKEPDRQARNKQRLTEMDPSMRVPVRGVLTRLEKHGFRPRIQAAWRSKADQLAAYNAGRSQVKFGFHNISGPGPAHPKQSLACDVLDDDNPLNPGTTYLLRLAIAAHAEHLHTGILWGLKPALAAGVSAAIASLDTGRDVQVGWDPTHLEPVGISITQAKAGARPKFGAAAPPPPPAGPHQFHGVVKGDTLSAIARDTHQSLLDILLLNPAKRANPNLILIGEEIRTA
jgi:LysM domain